jgi:hypothetical protein
LSWSDVPGKALGNIPSSAGNLAKAIVDPLLSPVQTLTNLGYLAAGGMRAGAKAVLPEAVFKALDSDATPEAAKRMDDATGAFSGHMKDRYGSSEGLKKTLATDPVGALADVATVMTLGGAGAARAPGLIGQAGQKVQQVGTKIDPIANTFKAAANVAPLVSQTMGVLTGAGARPFSEAYKAGKQGGSSSAALIENMRNQRPAGDVVDLAESAVNQMGRERSAAYVDGMNNVKASTSQIDFVPIQNAIGEASSKTHYNGIVKDAAAEALVKQMFDKVGEFRRLPPEFQTPAALDALKQAVGEVRQTTQQGTLARSVTSDVYNAIRSEIERQVPGYAATMKGYANASDNIAEMRRTMSVSDKAMPDTTLRKLQSTMRNNVNTNYGQRERLLDALAKYEPNLPPALAGQSLNAWAPRGLARTTPGQIVAGGAAVMNPSALMALPLTSPRVMGEAALASGMTIGRLNNVLRRYGITSKSASNAAMASYAAGAADRSRSAKDKIARTLVNSTRK